MKTVQVLLIILATSFASINSHAQDAKVSEDTITVEGVCDMCKKRIEDAAYGKGVKFVSWDKNTKLLSIAYRTDKTSLEAIEQRIVKAGHSTENTAAVKDDYDSLPDCCRYEELHTH